MKDNKKTTKETINRSVEANIDPTRKNENKDQAKKIRDKYTDDNDNLSDGVREMNPNRNVDKDDATNAGGYKQ